MVRHVAAVVVLVLSIVLCHHGALANKDGFNLYKDYLRGKNDELAEDMIMREDNISPKFLYFYRASPNVVLPIFGDLLQTSESINKKSLMFGKRTVNQFKNYMLTREPPDLQIASENVAAAIIKGLRAASGRPIPVRTSIAKRETTSGEENGKATTIKYKRALN